MRKTLILVSFGILAVAALIFAAQFILWLGFDYFVHSSLVPKAKDGTGSEITVGNSSANILGKVEIKEIVFSNPSHESQPEFLKIGEKQSTLNLLPLLFGIVDLKESIIKNAAATIVKTRDGKLNISDIPERKKRGRGEKKEKRIGSPENNIEDNQQKIKTKIILRKAIADCVIDYIDHTPKGDPLKLAFSTLIEIQNLSTFQRKGSENASISIKAHLLDKPDFFNAELKGSIEPLTNTDTPSFVLNGSVINLDLERLSPLFRGTKITAEDAILDVQAVCREGVYIQPSGFTLTLKNAHASGGFAGKGNTVSLPPVLKIETPLEGTFYEPKVDWETAATKTLIEIISKDPSFLLRSLKIDEKNSKELEKGIKSIAEFLKQYN